MKLGHGSGPRAARSAVVENGFSLLELVVVLTLVGVLASVGISRYGQSTYGNLGAQGDARRIALDLLQAQRRSIATGANHYLQFTPASGSATSYTVYRRAAGGDVAVDAPHPIPSSVTVTPNAAVMEFNFEGAALAAYTVSIAGADRSWTASVVPLTGAIRVLEIP